MSLFDKCKSKAKSKAKGFMIHDVFPKVYGNYAKEPVDPKKVIFLEMRTDHITNTFRPLYDTLTQDYDLNVKCHFLRYSFVSEKEYTERSLIFLKDAATASVIFVNDACNVISAVPIRKETTVIQLWHACGAFKRFGLSTADLKFGNSREQAKKFPAYKNLDYVTVSSPEVVWAYAEAMDLEQERDKIVPVGVSRTDLFYQEDAKAEAFQHLKEVMPESEGKRVILYAPTFRGNTANAVLPDALDIEQMYSAFGEDSVLLIKHHPFIRERHPIDPKFRSFAKDVTEELSIEDLLFVSDVCISDYSSLIFEYSLMEKPMLFFAYDLKDYFDWRGFYYNYENLTPGPVVTTTEELVEQLKHLGELDLSVVRQFKEKFMSACDGHATERILKLAFGDRLEQYRKQ